MECISAGLVMETDMRLVEAIGHGENQREKREIPTRIIVGGWSVGVLTSVLFPCVTRKTKQCKRSKAQSQGRCLLAAARCADTWLKLFLHSV